VVTEAASRITILPSSQDCHSRIDHSGPFSRKDASIASRFPGSRWMSLVKFAWTKIDKAGANQRNQYLVQYQVYPF
jgi:hypothetical protein